jgi:hypothetical protein
MLADFSFHIDLGAGEIQLYPQNDDLIFSDKQDTTFGFYRRTLDTELVFKRESFYALYAVEQTNVCQDFDLIIKYKGQVYYTGILKFRTQNMKWDIDKCRVDVKLDPQDAYTCLLDNWDREFNALNAIYTRQTVSFLEGTIEETICIDDPCTEFLCTVPYDCISGGAEANGWTLVSHSVITNIGDTDRRVSTYKRITLTVPCVGGIAVPPAGDGWILESDNCPTDATYVRPVNVVYDGANSYFIERTGTPDEVWYYQQWNVVGLNQTAEIGEIDNGILLNDLIGNEFTVLNCKGLAIRSNFLNLNPQGASPSTKPYTEPRTHKLVFFQKSDVVYFNAGQNATYHLWSFKRIMEVLVALYDVEVRIVGNNLRIEHRTYFEGVNDLDLTSPTYEKFIEGYNQYEYDTFEMPKKETWRYREPVTFDFSGSPILYDCNTNADNPEVLFDIPDVNNDVAYLLNLGRTESLNGFVIVETDEIAGNRFMVSRYIYNTTNLYVNGAHSIPSLIDHFWRWERPNLTGLMNDSIETFNTTIRRKKQTELNVKMSTEAYRDLVPDNLIRTQISWGKAREYRWSARSCKLSVTVYHT